MQGLSLFGGILEDTHHTVYLKVIYLHAWLGLIIIASCISSHTDVTNWCLNASHTQPFISCRTHRILFLLQTSVGACKLFVEM